MLTNKHSFIDDVLQDAIDVRRAKGNIHLIPLVLFFCLFLGGLSSYYFPADFFQSALWGVSATVYSGILAFNAITLALSWSAIGRILEIISNPGFSSFLKGQGMLNKYSFYVTFIHAIQVTASTSTLIALVMIFIPLVTIWGHRVIWAVVIGTTLYALRWSVGAVRITRDLIIHFATYDGLDPGEQQQLRMAVNNE